MTTDSATDLRYPVGRFTPPTEGLDAAARAALIDQIAALPGQLRAAVGNWSDERLDTPYRPGGWTVRQLVHHIADSHMNGFVRWRLALTEDSPTIKPYDEARWAELPDMKLPIEVSLTLLERLHERWVTMLRGLTDEQFGRAYVHPEMGRPVRLDESLANYAWHSRHHLAHATSLAEREGWSR